MEKTISYLVPSYNHEKYILALLESIKIDMKSLSVDSEVIIIDDGSIDNSASIIQKWVKENENYIDIYFSNMPANRGLSAVLNKLISLSNGKYLRLAASDDILIEGSTKKLFAAFFNKPALFCSFGDGIVIDDESNEIHGSSIAYHGGNVEKLLCANSLKQAIVHNWCLAGPCCLIKKSHYDVMKYDEYSTIDDFDLYLSLLEKKDSLVFLNDIVCMYRVHSSNTSKTRSIQKRIDNLKSFLKITNRYINKGILKNELLPVRYQTSAKISYLKKNYILSIIFMVFTLFFRMKYSLVK